MRRILVVLAFLFLMILPVKADVMPYYLNNINPNSIGVYQADKNIKIYKEPNVYSPLLLSVTWNGSEYNCTNVSASNLFVVFLQKKELAFLTVLDENDGEDWVQVAYNQNGLKTGWVKKDDDFRFMNWRIFFNLYGRKYGLYYMKDAPDESKIILGSTNDDAKEIGKITLAQTLKLTNISGNYALVIAFDIDKYQKIGWIRWRDISGKIYLFPDIK